MFTADGSETWIDDDDYCCLQYHDGHVYAMLCNMSTINVFTYSNGQVIWQTTVTLAVEPKRSFAVTSEHFVVIDANNTAQFVCKDSGDVVSPPERKLLLAGDACICQVDDAGTILCSAGADKLYELQCNDPHAIPVEFSTSQQDTIFGAGKLNGKLFVGAGKTLTMFTSGDSQQDEVLHGQKQKSTVRTISRCSVSALKEKQQRLIKKLEDDLKPELHGPG